MFVEHVNPNTRSVGGINLLPGINRIPDKQWDELAKSQKWAKPIKGLIEDGIIIVKDAREKITVALVNKTFDPELLDEWMETAKGPLLGAIRKQLEALKIEEEL